MLEGRIKELGMTPRTTGGTWTCGATAAASTRASAWASSGWSCTSPGSATSGTCCPTRERWATRSSKKRKRRRGRPLLLFCICQCRGFLPPAASPVFGICQCRGFLWGVSRPGAGSVFGICHAKAFFASGGPREYPPRGIAAAAYAKNMPLACFLNAAVPRPVAGRGCFAPPGASDFCVQTKVTKSWLRALP